MSTPNDVKNTSFNGDVNHNFQEEIEQIANAFAEVGDFYGKSSYSNTGENNLVSASQSTKQSGFISWFTHKANL